jgi:hypothetical protein
MDHPNKIDGMTSEYLMNNVPELLCAFQVKKIKDARLVWINHRYLFQSGYKTYNQK